MCMRVERERERDLISQMKLRLIGGSVIDWLIEEENELRQSIDGRVEREREMDGGDWWNVNHSLSSFSRPSIVLFLVFPKNAPDFYGILGSVPCCLLLYFTTTYATASDQN